MLPRLLPRSCRDKLLPRRTSAAWIRHVQTCGQQRQLRLVSGLHFDWSDVYIDAELVWPTSPVWDISGPSRQEYMVPTDLYVHTVNAHCEEYDGGRNVSAASAFYNRIILLLNVCDTLI
jgi:hypothetical protein